MKKSILNLEGAQELSKAEQKNISGGVTRACADELANNNCVLLLTGCIGDTHVVYSPACGRNICCPVV